MQGHERYEELCALCTISQLSEQEVAELEEHLRLCESCKDVQSDYSVILDQLPGVAAGTNSITHVISKARREKFIRRMQHDGIAITAEAARGATRRRGGIQEMHLWWGRIGLAAAALTVVVCAVYYSESHNSNRPPVAALSAAAISQQTLPESLNAVSPVKSAVEESPSQAVSRRLGNLEARAESLKEERDEIEVKLLFWQNKSKELADKSEADSRFMGQAKERLAALEATQSELTAALVEKQDRIRELSSQISSQHEAAERERELNGAARDVRELMAARNLHIIDVADVDGRGKARKSFGRVFYVEGRTLLFYAFDLGELTSASKVLFQAWGQREGSGGKPRNLGVFQVDDQAQKRWVLRVSDPKLLASMDSLFVTVEPSPGADQPTGRRLIYAYLGTPANHP